MMEAFRSLEEKQAYLAYHMREPERVMLAVPFGLPCTTDDCLNVAMQIVGNWIAEPGMLGSWGRWEFSATCKQCMLKLTQMYNIPTTGTVDSTLQDTSKEIEGKSNE